MPRKIRSSDKELFAERLRRARELKFEYAYTFAQALGIEAETYRRYERAETEPDLTTLKKIAEKLDVSLDYLVAGKLPRQPMNPALV